MGKESVFLKPKLTLEHDILFPKIFKSVFLKGKKYLSYLHIRL